MKTNRLFLFFVLSFCFTSCSSEDAHDKQKVALDNEIKELNHQLTAHRIKEMNFEMESQPMKFEEWSDYAKTLEKAEKEEHSVQKLEKRIELLQKQRNELQKKPSL